MYDIITIGAATRDAFIKTDVFKTIQDKRFKTGKAGCIPLGAKMEIPEIVFTSGGGATNAAVTFARQGLKTAVLAKIGKDVSGEAIKRELQAEKAVIDLIIIEKSLPTAYSIILINSTGDRSVLVYRGASASFQVKDVDISFNAKWVYISSLAGRTDILKEIIGKKKNNDIKIAANPGSGEIKDSKNLIPLLKYIDVLIMNREEGSYLTGIDFEKNEQIFKQLDEWVESGLVVLTDGKNGVMVSDGIYRWKAGVFSEKEIIDRTGAGDAFGSGFVASLISNSSIEEAIRIGSANATSVVEHIGAKAGILGNKEIHNSRWRNFKISKVKSRHHTPKSDLEVAKMSKSRSFGA